MKKIVLLSILSGLLWTACTKQETLTYTPGEDEVSSSFMAVNIVSAGAVGTRATENGTYTDNNGTYRDGEVYENHINDALFFFFDDAGKAAKAFLSNDGKEISYSEWTVENNSGASDHDQTVEKILSKTLVFKMLPNAAEPTKVLAVLNPTDEIKKVTQEKGGLSLSELNDIVSDFEGYDNGNKKLAPRIEDDAKQQGFVMSNSVYVEGEGTSTRIVSTTDCTGKFYPTQEEAKKNFVVIYVERVLARIDLTVDIKDHKMLNGNTIIYPLADVPKNAWGDDTNLTDPKLYVRFLGWNVFDTPKKSRLIKSVDPNWTSVQLFGKKGIEPWNAAIYHRSFWAINPEGLKKDDVEDNSDYRFGPFKEGKQVEDEDFKQNTWTASHNSMPESGTYVTDYFQENAAPYEDPDVKPAIPSKVIIAAQLVNNNGKPQSLARWRGKLSTEEGLKTYLANQLNLWKKGTTTDKGDGTTEIHYTKISKDDLEFVKEVTGSSLRTVKLKTPNAEWYSQVTPGSSYNLVIDAASVVSTTCGEKNISVWTEGYTYYYFTIRHLGEKNTDATQKEVPGEFGVVRNHIYEVHVKSVDGIGVPVPDPSDDIVTTEPDPEDEESFLSAEVRILSWRVVRQDYDLTW